MSRINALTDSDVAVLRQLVTDFRRRRPPARYPTDLDAPPAPEVYVAKVPAEGIPALSYNLGTGTSAFDMPGSADCDIYVRLNIGGTEELRPVPNLSRTVFNLSDSDVTGGVYVPIVRDKFGTWVVLQQGNRPVPPTTVVTVVDHCTGLPRCFSVPAAWEEFDCSCPGTGTGSPFGCQLPYQMCVLITGCNNSCYSVYGKVTSRFNNTWGNPADIVDTFPIPSGGVAYFPETCGIDAFPTLEIVCDPSSGNIFLVMGSRVTELTMVSSSPVHLVGTIPNADECDPNNIHVGNGGVFPTGGDLTVNVYDATLGCPPEPTGTGTGGGGTWADTFTDADGTDITAHTPDTSPGGAGYSATAGEWQILSDQLTTATFTTAASMTFDPGLASATFDVNFVINDVANTDQIAVIARYIATANQVSVNLQPVGDGTWLLTIDDNVTTTSANIGTLTQGTSYTLNVTTSATDVSASCNGTAINQPTTVGYGNTPWLISVTSNTSTPGTVSFDDLSVVP